MAIVNMLITKLPEVCQTNCPLSEVHSAMPPRGAGSKESTSIKTIITSPTLNTLIIMIIIIIEFTFYNDSIIGYDIVRKCVGIQLIFYTSRTLL